MASCSLSELTVLGIDRQVSCMEDRMGRSLFTRGRSEQSTEHAGRCGGYLGIHEGIRCQAYRVTVTLGTWFLIFSLALFDVAGGAVAVAVNFPYGGPSISP